MERSLKTASRATREHSNNDEDDEEGTRTPERQQSNSAQERSVNHSQVSVSESQVEAIAVADGGLEAESDDGSKHAINDEVLLRKDAAATILQTIIRKKLIAPYRVKRRFFAVFLRVFDPRFRIYFWYNRLTKSTQWTRPCPRITTEFTKQEINTARILQRVLRGFIGEMRARKVSHKRYTRYFDAKQKKPYWVDNTTQVATWNASKWLLRQEIPMPNEDSLLVQSQQRIRELEDMLKKKDEEIKATRVKRFEELEPLVLRDKGGWIGQGDTSPGSL
jgi:hypothetical protein